jgi:hypothetical protein
MKAIRLRSSIHKIVDQIQDEQFLQTLHNFLRTHKGSQTGKLWNTLTETQKEEILLAYEESENEKNLIDADKVIHQKPRHLDDF